MHLFIQIVEQTVLDGKTYPIKYQITGIGNKLNSMTAKVNKIAPIANIVSLSNGKLQEIYLN
jgi:hypothetical protein